LTTQSRNWKKLIEKE
jgi:hypothetical protein